MTVTQASDALGIHPTQIRLLIRRGDLAGERLGAQWVIPRAELERFATRAALAGRLFSPRIAWSVIAALEGVTPSWTLTREERARVRNYAERPLDSLFGRLGGRGRTERLSVGPGGLERVPSDLRWVRGTAALQKAPGVVYTTEDDLEALFDASNAVLDAAQPNLLLRVVADKWWPFGEEGGGASAWPTVLTLDRFELDRAPPGTGE
jgi:excisionase family DNA binding protein